MAPEVHGRTCPCRIAVPLREIISIKLRRKILVGNSSLLQRDPPLVNRTAEWKNGSRRGPYPILGPSRDLSQVKFPSAARGQAVVRKVRQCVWTGRSEADSHSGLFCGSTQSQMQSLSQSHKHDPG